MGPQTRYNNLLILDIIRKPRVLSEQSHDEASSAIFIRDLTIILSFEHGVSRLKTEKRESIFFIIFKV